MRLVQADFSGEPGPEWKRHVVAPSAIEAAGDSWRFVNYPVERKQYTNAQIDDYQGLARGDFKWRPPTTLTVRARFSHNFGEFVGTAGFGFWNDPLVMTGVRLPAVPRAIWFFHGSPETNLKLDVDMPGAGWKAATVDARNLRAYLLGLTAPLAVPLMNVPFAYRALWPRYQRAIKAQEALLDVNMTEWHTYVLQWGTERAQFSVDERIVLDAGTPPDGRLGFVMWIDNQAMVATPQGRIGWKTVPVERQQWMEVDRLRIEQE